MQAPAAICNRINNTITPWWRYHNIAVYICNDSILVWIFIYRFIAEPQAHAWKKIDNKSHTPITWMKFGVGSNTWKHEAYSNEMRSEKRVVYSLSTYLNEGQLQL